MDAREWGRGILGKGMEAKELGRGNFLSLFLCLHSFAKSGLGIGVEIQVEHGAFNGPLLPLACGEPEC